MSAQQRLAERQARRTASVAGVGGSTGAAAPVRGSNSSKGSSVSAASSSLGSSSGGGSSSSKGGKPATAALDGGKPRKVKIQVEFEITVLEISGLDDHEGQFLTVSWKRGGKPNNRGATPQAMVKRGSARWDHNMALVSVLQHHTGTGAFQSKSLTFSVDEVDPKGKHKTIASSDMNLGTFCSAKNPEAGDQKGPWGRVERVAVTVDVKGAKKAASAANPPRLSLVIKSKWLKFDGKLIVPLKPNEPGKEKKAKLTYAGNDFGLETDPDGGVSEATTLGLSSIMDSNDDASEISDEDDMEEMSSARGSGAGPSSAVLAEPSRRSSTASGPMSGFKKLGKAIGGGGGGGGEERAILSKTISSIEEECRSLSDSAALGYWLGFSTSLLGLLCNASRSQTASQVRERLQQEGLHAVHDLTPSAAEIRSMAADERVLWVLYLVSYGVQQRLVKSFYPVVEEIMSAVSPTASGSKFEGDVVSKPLYKIAKMLRPFNLPPIIFADVAYSLMYALRARIWNAVLDKPDKHATFRFGLRLKLAVAETKNWVLNCRFFRRAVVLQPLDFLQDVAGVLVVSKDYFSEASVDEIMRTFVNISAFELRQLLRIFVPQDDIEDDERPGEDVVPKLDVACNRLQASAPKDLHYDLVSPRFPEK